MHACCLALMVYKLIMLQFKHPWRCSLNIHGIALYSIYLAYRENTEHSVECLMFVYTMIVHACS